MRLEFILIKKDYFIYINNNNISELKISRYCFGIRLNDNEKNVLSHIINNEEKNMHIT